MTAFGAADNDLSFPPGDPDLLGALGTFINMVVPGLGGAAPEISEKARDSGLQGQKLPVLTVTFGNISGEDAEIHIKEHCPAKQADGPDPQEKVDGYQDQQHHRQKAGELVHPVAPLHKAGKFITQVVKHRSPFCKSSCNPLVLTCQMEDPLRSEY